MVHSRYRILDRVLLRSPIHSTNFYPHRPAESSPIEGIRALWADEAFRESVYVASPVLADQVDALLPTADGAEGGNRKGQEKKVQTLYRALLKYAIRISTRTTPFGLFGGSAMVGLGDEPLVLGPEGDHQKHARVGFTYLKHITDAAVADLGDRLRVVTNPTVYLAGDRIAVMANPQSADGKVETFSIRNTPPVRHVISMAREPVALSAIHQSLGKTFPDAQREVLNRFINELVERGILITELTPSAFDTSPMDRWMRADLDSDGQLAQQLRAAQDAIAAYRDTAIGKGIDELRAVYSALRTDANAGQEQLQVDLSLAMSGQIPAHVATKVEAAVSVMMRVTAMPVNFPELQRHTERFTDVFGQSLVPLHRMFDPEQGIGAPSGYPSSRHPAKEGATTLEETFRAGRRLRAALIDRARRTGKHTVAITSSDLAAFPPVPGIPPTTYDVFFQLDQGDNDEIRITQSPIGVVIHGGKAGGRFAYGDPAIDAHVRDVADAEKAAHPETILCELDYVSNRSRVNNVVASPRVYDYQLKVTTGAFDTDEPTVEQIAFADLLVGVEDGRFHLVHAATGKRVLIHTANLVNPEINIDVIRFLHEISLDGTNRPAWTWGELEPLAEFLPGVEYEGVTLSLPKWRIPPLSGAPEDQDGQLLRWATEVELPEYIYVGTLDNRLLLHMVDPIHRDLLRREAADGVEFVTEAPAPGQMGAVRGRDGHRYASEAVFSAVARRPVSAGPPPLAPHFDTTVDSERTLPPGTEWWYLCVYGEREDQNEILSRLGAAGDTFPGNWFFIRYADPDDHLRIRVRSAAAAFDRVREVISGCVRDGLAQRYTVDTYVREIERYGGVDAMPIAERIFCAESQFLAVHPTLCMPAEAMRTAHRLDDKGTLSGTLSRIVRDAAHLMDHYLAALGLDDEEADSLLEIIASGYRSEFSAHSPALRKAVRPLVRQQPSDAAIAAGPLLHSALLPDTQAFNASLVKADGPWRRRAMTLQSLLHMFANRMGLPRSREYQALFLLSVIRRSQAHRKGQSGRA
ncbi:lantibiotic dehydratase [Streptomyces halobius]|uniref:Lantibiotic dehydratase n=1 Tax=Streptomyces halobius TaxID=2879846 RepID=A0ABY4MAM4_9ACTN|nr:lantibiotic dehydratase [Streptomyces halobius]UQA94462.1 lantibiotic dehydratase [Streptomyces halobius]